MAKEKVAIQIAGIKTVLLSGSPENLVRMANSINSAVNSKLKYVGDREDIALMLVALEQAESLRRNAELIRNQQETVFELATRNSQLIGNEDELGPTKDVENTLIAENKRLSLRIDELLDEIEALKTQSSL